MRSFVLLLVSVVFSCSVVAQPVIPGLLANWKMNGNFNDAGGNGINGTNFSATATTNKAGQANAAMNFVNPANQFLVNQFGSFPANNLLKFTGTQNFSISLLVFAATPYIRPCGFIDNNLNYGGYGVWYWINGSGTLQVNFNYKGGVVSTPSFTMNSWVHITAVRNAGVLSLYLNGNLAATAPEGSIPQTYNFNGVFASMLYAAGGYPNNVYSGHVGKLDEISVYNRALSAAEITSLASFLLPLKLGDFSAVKKASGTSLLWQTISETNTKNFVIERSSDGTTFSAIGEVAAAGNSSQSRNYEFSDATPAAGTVYYRLRMNDLDGTATLSRVVAVTNNRFAGQLKVFPNPAVDQVQFQWQGQQGKQVQVEIMDLAGRIRFSRNYQLQDGVQTFSLPLAGFSSGLYTLRVKDAAGQQSTIFSKN